MLAWSSVAQLGNSVPYHSSGNPCRVYSAEEFLGLINAATQFKTYNLTYCNLLKQQVSEMTDAEEIKNIKYGDSLNEKYQNMLNQLLMVLKQQKELNNSILIVKYLFLHQEIILMIYLKHFNQVQMDT